MIEHLFNTTAEKIATKTNEFGDVVYDNASTTYPCRFQEKLGLQYQNNAELMNTDALAWFSKDADVQVGDIFKFQSGFYRISKVIGAIGRSGSEFRKCTMEKHKTVDVENGS